MCKPIVENLCVDLQEDHAITDRPSAIVRNPWGERNSLI
jgi:hypothetical protein